MTKKTPHEARPVCPECGAVVDPKLAQVLHTLRGDETWIASPDLIKGVYCSSDHLLNAYLRGWPSHALQTPNHKRRRR